MEANASLREKREYSFSRDFRIGYEEYDYYNALVAAASRQSWMAVLSIIETVKANSTNDCGHDIAFYFACKYKNLDAARKLYAAGASIRHKFIEVYKTSMNNQFPPMYQFNSMQWALLNDDPDMVCFLLSAGYELSSSLLYTTKNQQGDGYSKQTMDLDQFVTLYDCRATLSKGLLDFKNDYQNIKNNQIFKEHTCHLESIAKEKHKEKAASEKTETLKNNKQNFLTSVNDFLRPLKKQNHFERCLIWKSNERKDIDTIEQLHKSKDVEEIKAFIKNTKGTSKVSKKLSEFLEQNQVNQDFSGSIDMQGPSI
ncbi:hypothetical protein [Legionella fairfieldensis]|uniref:hypothetical protein n=1 Tax=Legionella fairfieldensis TaxID=45064 RepID=UPI00048D7EF0|nr:hypothetical protein [Legionella fairfieldensis]